MFVFSSRNDKISCWNILAAFQIIFQFGNIILVKPAKRWSRPDEENSADKLYFIVGGH